jgi:hypothetical protein
MGRGLLRARDIGAHRQPRKTNLADRVGGGSCAP